MGPKKRDLAPRSKPSSPAAAEAASASPGPTGGGEVSQTEQSVEGRGDASYSAIKLECERALTALRRGNHTKALRLIKDVCQRREKSALVHRCQATICAKVAGIMDEQTAKLRYLKSGIESARRAYSLSPNSVEFAHFYANLLYEAAHEGKDYEEVVRECERGLAIENPIDPGKESFQVEQKIPTAEGRIASIQQELRSLIQKANLASISTWMKNLGPGNGEEKFRLIPIRRPPEDPMEMRLAQTRRPNEIKKATKTPEEKRKEIEVRVAAARLLQQKSECQGESKAAEFNSGRVSSNSNKSSERRKPIRRNVSSPERKDQVMPYWNSMIFERKRDLLSIRVSDLRAHCRSLKDGLGYEVLSEALSFGEMKKTWKCWECYRCGETFVDGKSYMNHAVQAHMGNLMPKLQTVLPPAVDSEWVEMLLNCSWQPLDLTASTRLLENQLKFEDAEFGEKFYKEKGKEERTDCWTDSYCSEDVNSFAEKNLVACCNGSSLESVENDKNLKLNHMACKKVYTLPDSWPFSDDSVCSELLDKVSSIFQLLIRHKCLSGSHLQKVIQFTMDELQAIAPGSPLFNCGIDQTPVCMCFLGADQLKKIIEFLQEVSHACGAGRYPEKIGHDNTRTAQQLLESQDKLVLKEDASSLLLDENLLPSDGVSGDVGSMTSAVLGTESCTNSTSDSLLSWIYAGPSTGEHLVLWSRMKEERKQQAMELLELLEKEFGHLQSMCERKYEHLGYEESLQGLEELCVEECKKRDHLMEFTRSGYDSVLRKRREEIIEGDNDAVNSFELDAITNVLKEAENIKESQHIYKETYVGVTSHVCDIESREEDRKSKDYLNQVDACLEIAIQQQKEQLSAELSKIDARIMRSVSSIQQLEHKLESDSTLDYCSILLPLVKSFMRAHLEDLAEKDATEKSDAAREAFLAELALDSEKNVSGVSDHSKHTQSKLKDKKRIRDSKKTKNAKISSFSNHADIAEPASSYAGASDGECADPEMPVSRSDDDLRNVEEDFQRKINFEAEERKLEEILEYQRRIENEAKQKHLAKQWRRTAQTASGDVLQEWSDVSSPHCISVCKQFEQEAVEINNNLSKYFSHGQSDTVDGATLLTDYSAVIQNHQSKSSKSSKSLKFSQGLSNEGVQHDNTFPTKEQMGKKGKRKGHAKLPEGRHQPVPSGKENMNVGISAIEVRRDNRDDVSGVCDGGSKTLGQLHAEEDDEERFQADLERAVRQSLDTFQTNWKMPLASNSRTLQEISGIVDHMSPLGEVREQDERALDVHGTGLQNEVGEYNCFLNVIIQSLWHLPQFRGKFLSRPTIEHVHVGDPCVVCALYDVLMALNKASMDAKREAVSPTSLRVALSNLYPESNFFHEGQMNDASEVLSVIFECLHQSVTSTSSASDDDSVESNCLGSWDCAKSACIAHSLFGMNIYERMNCYNCGLESRHLKYTSFFHNINANALRTMKAMCDESSFDEILNSVEMNQQLACDPEAGGCGKLNHIHHILTTPPHVFTTVLGWQNTCENVDDIAATLAALATEIDISVLYRGVDPKNMHRLVSVVCYYGQHYHCFAYSPDSEQWIMYDDKMVKAIGTWEDVVAMCVRGRLQPQVLFYQAID